MGAAALSTDLTVDTLLLEGQVLLICLDIGGRGQGSASLHGARWARSGQLSAQRPAGRARWASRRRGGRDRIRLSEAGTVQCSCQL